MRKEQISTDMKKRVVNMKPKHASHTMVLLLCIFLSTIGSACAQRDPRPGGPALVDLTPAAEHTVNTVVHINAEMLQKNSMWDNFFSDPFFNFFNFQAQPQVYQAYGSGVILSEDGYIVTNNHVVAEAQKVTVTLNDQRKFEARIIGTDEATDLALLKIDAKGLDYIEYGNSDEVRLGEWVLAVGNPYNLNSTVTAGIVSAKARNLDILGNGSRVETFIQTDAAVNSGNSGGALVNVQGKLIGINAAIASNTGSYAGYSFAIPVNVVKKVVAELKQYGRVKSVNQGVAVMKRLGAEFQPLTQQVKQAYQVDHGLTVTRLDDGLLKRAGVQNGYVILSVDRKPVYRPEDLETILGNRRGNVLIEGFYPNSGFIHYYNLTL